MASKVLRGFREVPRQDGSGKTTIERIPYFGLDSSAKQGQKNRNRNAKRRRVKAVAGGFSALFTPVKK